MNRQSNRGIGRFLIGSLAVNLSSVWFNTICIIGIFSAQSGCKVRNTTYGATLKATGGEYPIVEIELRKGYHTQFIEGSLTADYINRNAFAERFTKPFIYQSDFETDGDASFIVGGDNETEKLRKISTITGEDFKTLNLRMRGTGDITTGAIANSLLEKLPHWQTINNQNQRRSGPGFLMPNQDLRQMLIKDNDIVKSLGLNHQQIAAPLLTIIAAVEENGEKEVEVEISSVPYSVKAIHMGGEYHLSNFRSNDERDNFHSGWIGYGTQGSCFKDELFANWYFSVTNQVNEQVLMIDALTPHLIHRYGFYQGGPFRKRPEEISKFFGLGKS